MTRNKVNLILEIIWIITGMLCVAAGIRIVAKSGNNTRALLFALMAIISFLFATFRHFQRKKS